MDLSAFVEEVGADGPVVPVGGRTQWDVGGAPVAGGREVRPPAGIVAYEPADMTVRVRAGTTVADLDAALRAHGQMAPLDPAHPARATVGGVLGVGHSGLRRLRYGPVRDTVLEVRFVSAEGQLVKGGGPVVKNVSGYDLCRLLVGSLGTLGVLAEVVLRVQPVPTVSRWLRADHADPFAVRRSLYRPSAVLWNGTTTWVLLEGRAADVAAQADVLGPAFADVDGPPTLPPYRRSRRPSALPELHGDPTGTFVAEVGVGTVHVSELPPPPAPERADLHRRIKAVFDPAGRLNPGRLVA